MARSSSDLKKLPERKPVSFAVEPAFPAAVAKNSDHAPVRVTPVTTRVRGALVLRAVPRDVSIVKGSAHARAR
jgi:hypothetical protein